MQIAKLTSKGQITIPVDVRRKLDLHKGSRVLFVEQGNNFLMINEGNTVFRLSDQQVEAALNKGWKMENILSLGSINDPTFAAPPDIPSEYDTPIEEFD